MNEAVVQVRGLRTQFGSHVVHDGLDLDLNRGEILGVVGGSGTGKSVLLRAIVGLDAVRAGTIDVLGNRIGTLSGPDRRALEQRWGVMFQDGALFSSLTVRENVEVPLRAVPGLTNAQCRGLAELKIGMAGLPWKANDDMPADLSGGMRKRAGTGPRPGPGPRDPVSGRTHRRAGPDRGVRLRPADRHAA